MKKHISSNLNLKLSINKPLPPKQAINFFTLITVIMTF